ncbi:MAG: YcfL family protein [Lentisphaeria bacterium]|nr:YcfL family protein [Lentisphaeria bacterium]
MKKRLFITALAAGAALFCGCQNTVNTVENAEKNMTPNTIKETRFVTDGFLRDRLALKNVTTARNAGGFLRVQLEVVNMRTGVFAQAWSGMTGENPYQIQYKFDWFDQDGMQVQTVLSNWRNATVIPGETLYLQGVAPSVKCADFKISLKEFNH